MEEQESDRLVRIETKLDMFLKSQADHEARIRSIERWMYSVPATLLVAMGSAVAAVVALFTGK